MNDNPFTTHEGDEDPEYKDSIRDGLSFVKLCRERNGEVSVVLDDLARKAGITRHAGEIE